MAVEINKDQPNKKSKGSLFRASKGVSTVTSILTEIQSKAERGKSFTVEKREATRYALMVGW